MSQGQDAFQGLSAPPGPKTVQIDDLDTRAEIGVVLGMRAALDILEKSKIGADLAGKRLAMIEIRQDADRRQLALFLKITRIAARAGIDLGAWQAWTYGPGLATMEFVPIPEELTDAGGEDG